MNPVRARYLLVLLAAVFLLLVVSTVMSVALANAPLETDSTALRIGGWIGILLIASIIGGTIVYRRRQVA